MGADVVRTMDIEERTVGGIMDMVDMVDTIVIKVSRGIMVNPKIDLHHRKQAEIREDQIKIRKKRSLNQHVISVIARAHKLRAVPVVTLELICE